jgi:hypothetical protein
MSCNPRGLLLPIKQYIDNWSPKTPKKLTSLICAVGTARKRFICPSTFPSPGERKRKQPIKQLIENKKTLQREVVKSLPPKAEKSHFTP